MNNSIRRQLMFWLTIPLTTLLVVSALCTYLLAQYFTTDLYDRQLINTADSVAGRIRVVGSKVKVDLPRGAEEIFRHNNRDEFYYQIFAPYGLRLAGDEHLPAPEVAPAVGEPPIFKSSKIHGKDVRIAIIRMLAPESPMGSVIIQVAETKNARTELIQQILAGIVLPQLLIITIAVVAVRVGISKGLSPLNKISAAIGERSPQDLSPINLKIVPDEVTNFIMALNDLLERARQDITRQRRFASNAAHQLRTPLAGLKTYAQLAEKETDLEKVKELVRTQVNGLDRMTRTVQQLLSLSKAEHAITRTSTFKPVDLNIVVSDATTDIVPESIERQVELDFQAEESQALVEGDSISLRELTTNLLENAIRYNRPGGTVVINVTNKDTIDLIIEDDGIGIPEGERERVFERFYRVTGSDLDITGSGLGLAIVYEIARAHNAEVAISEGAEGKGTRVKVTFPKVEIQEDGESREII
ncbi:hypothetical protein GC174_14610 [bacterium]|nr:hypothetical protein [bacterium]